VSRTIKRYANRKLYDTSRSSYITLDEIADLVKAGEEVEIIDNNSKEDLTAVTLAQILFEAEKRKKRVLPLSTLRTLIQSGGELIEKGITGPVANIRQEAEKRMSAGREAIAKTRDDAAGKVSTLQEQTHKTIEDLQRQVEERLTSVLSTAPKSTPTELDDPTEFDDIVARLDRIDARLACVEEIMSGNRVATGSEVSDK
jgi:polyhydroxyalkanoate synthesis repressor PhaR